MDSQVSDTGLEQLVVAFGATIACEGITHWPYSPLLKVARATSSGPGTGPLNLEIYLANRLTLWTGLCNVALQTFRLRVSHLA